MRLGVHTSNHGGGRFASDAGETGTVAAVENIRLAAKVLDGVVALWWPAIRAPGIAGSRSGYGEDERCYERGV